MDHASGGAAAGYWYALNGRERSKADAIQAEFDDYVRSVSGSSGGSAADEIGKLRDLRDSGAITDDEFQAQKAKLLA